MSKFGPYTDAKVRPHTILCVIIAVIALTMLTFNYFTHQYQYASYIGLNPILVLAPALAIFYFSKLIKSQSPQTAFVLYGFWLIVLTSAAINLFTSAIQTTPFWLQDVALQRWDLWLGFNIVDFVNWSHQFPWLIQISNLTYYSMIEQLIYIPFILIFLQQQKRLSVYLNICLITTLVGYLIYYFFPTSDPAHILSSPHFTKLMYSVPERFYDLKNHIPNQNIAGGIIGFPSFHVIWALCAVYAFKNYKVVFWPLLIWNSIAILSTLTLGWHFLVDDLASLVIFFITVPIAEHLSFGMDYSFKEMRLGYKKEFRLMFTKPIANDS